VLHSLGSFLQVASTILVLASLAGLGLMRGRVVDLREQLGDARNEITDNERRHIAELAERDRRLAVIEAEGAELRGKLEREKVAREALASEVRGDSKIESLSQRLDIHSGEARSHWLTVEELLRQLLKQITELLKRGAK
jgi:hypothetical protein